jgi:nucleolar MIF4G domain-containing protein 1
VQSLISDYHHHYATVGAQIDMLDETVGKECSNLIVLLSELYNFQVVASLLVYDVIRSLLQGELTEFNVELLLKLLRSASHYSSAL